MPKCPSVCSRSMMVCPAWNWRIRIPSKSMLTSSADSPRFSSAARALSKRDCLASVAPAPAPAPPRKLPTAMARRSTASEVRGMISWICSILRTAARPMARTSVVAVVADFSNSRGMLPNCTAATVPAEMPIIEAPRLPPRKKAISPTIRPGVSVASTCDPCRTSSWPPSSNPNHEASSPCVTISWPSEKSIKSRKGSSSSSCDSVNPRKSCDTHWMAESAARCSSSISLGMDQI